MNDQANAPEFVSAASGQLALPGQTLPDKLYIIPVHNRPFFPAQVLPVVVNEQPWSETLQRVAAPTTTAWRCFLSTRRPAVRPSTSIRTTCQNTAPWYVCTTPAGKAASCSSSPRA